jgi:hypothetical protein
MYRYLENFGMIDDFIPAIVDPTNLRETSSRTVEQAAMKMFGSAWSIEVQRDKRQYDEGELQSG